MINRPHHTLRIHYHNCHYHNCHYHRLSGDLSSLVCQLIYTLSAVRNIQKMKVATSCLYS